MAVPKFAAVIDALVVLARTTSATAVYDGPTVTIPVPVDFVVIGGTEDPEDDGSSFDQSWNGLGKRTKDEAGEITCAVLVGTGDDEVKAARDRALAILGEVEAAVRNDPSLGGVLVGGWAHVSGGRHVQRLTTEGLYVRITFTVAYQTKN
jgi:hypothetical protein